MRPSAPAPSSAAPTEPAFRALLRTVGLLKRVMEPYFARFGISGSQWALLVTLHRAEQQGESELRLSDVSDRLLIRPPSVTGVVDRLQRLGYLDRNTAEDDHRAKLVRLTPAGRRLVEQVLEQHAEQVKRVLGVFAAEEQSQLQQLLERLGAHLESMTMRPDAASATVEGNDETTRHLHGSDTSPETSRTSIENQRIG